MTEMHVISGDYGTKVIAVSYLSKSTIDYLIDLDIREIELNYAKGWVLQDLDFLSRFLQLRKLTIIAYGLSSLKPIHDLRELLALNLSTHTQCSVNFEAFPKLEECYFGWCDGSESLFECRTLRVLGLMRFRKPALPRMSSLKSLGRLSLLESSICSLCGIEELTRLEFLRLGNLKKLKELNGIDQLESLGEVIIDTCRAIEDPERLGLLANLKKLIYSNNGRLKSLQPFAKLSSLEKLTFAEKTVIEDGNLAPLLQLANLKEVLFQNRRHYSHTREEINALLVQRNA